MTTAAWIAFALALVIASARVGFLMGREAAESKAAETIANLRRDLRRVTGNPYLTDDPHRPE